MDFTSDGLNCLKCHHRHQDNGNCTAVGGFCTAVPAAHCPLIPELTARAEAAEARVLELETSHRTELCENGYDCVELGKVRKALAEAEARAEKADREIERLKEIMRAEGIVVIPLKYPGCKSEWNLPRRGQEIKRREKS